MSVLLKNTIRFALFILVQVFVLFKVPPLHRFITPYLYYLYILWLPFNLPRLWLTATGFLFGLTLDYFTNTPGLQAVEVAGGGIFDLAGAPLRGTTACRVCWSFCATCAPAGRPVRSDRVAPPSSSALVNP